MKTFKTSYPRAAVIAAKGCWDSLIFSAGFYNSSALAYLEKGDFGGLESCWRAYRSTVEEALAFVNGIVSVLRIAGAKDATLNEVQLIQRAIIQATQGDLDDVLLMSLQTEAA